MTYTQIYDLAPDTECPEEYDECFEKADMFQEDPELCADDPKKDVKMDDDSLKAYFLEMGKHPLLSPAEERILVKRYRENHDEEAGQKLIVSNLRLVVSIAMQYYDQNKHAFQLLDLIQEGNLGLLTALKKFDPGQGAKFATYATFWIRMHISRMISDSSRLVRIPNYLHEKRGKIMKSVKKLSAELGRNPDVSEIAADIREKPAVIMEAMKAGIPHGSLDAVIGNGETMLRLSDVIPDEEPLNDPAACAEESDLRQRLSEILNKTLKPRELTVIRMRFGFDDGEKKTLDSAAEVLGVSRERARQIEKEAILRLQNSSEIMRLKDFLCA